MEAQGVALARSVIVKRDLDAGRLVKPFDFVEQTNCAYYVVYRKQSLDSRKVQVVRDWLLAQANL